MNSFRDFSVHQTHDAKEKPLFVTNKITTTKYTFYDFIFKNLYEQFSRIANFYFLISMILLFVCPGIPISPVTAAFPLVIVVGVSAIREAMEDFQRHKSDKKINQTKTRKLKSTFFEDEKWENICVGDVIKVEKDEQIPADILIISTSDDNNFAYIDTCNLDGESNLKIKQSVPITSNCKDLRSLMYFDGKVRCDEPNNMLYTFNGCLEMIEDHNQYPLDNNNVILRCCTLRNTQWATGLVLYTGLETKIMMNSNAVRSKRSNLERGLNVKLISVFLFQIGLVLLCTICGFVYQEQYVYTGKSWYFMRENKRQYNGFVSFLMLFISHFMIINSMIPISLYVTLEIVRVFQALFVKWDMKMYDSENQVPADARTSNISDDLGQIEYVFSDKTGTLTRNEMEFMKCSIAGKMYGHGTTEVAFAAAKRQGVILPPRPDLNKIVFQDEEFFDILKSDQIPNEIEHFLLLLSICNSVIPEQDFTKPFHTAFQSSSPDEAALVSAAAQFGYILKEKGSQTKIEVLINDKQIEIEVLASLEFSSARKRSSIIIRHPITNQIVLYCKGADDLIFGRLSERTLYYDETKRHLQQFAADGLRTLCCAYRVLDEEFYQEWAIRFNEASCEINNREEAIDIVANEVESELLLLGATAIEDKLQIGVSDTIQSLLKAKINVWVITGDKKETAINIGFACSLLSSDMQLCILDSDNENDLRESLIRGVNSKAPKMALIASGASLYYLLNPINVDIFFTLCKKCSSVICCRVSPLQKALVVRTMREKTGKLALAIGDGANDVGMILEADVGVGISGKEGRQAVLSSDYSFGQFRFLARLLLVHGRQNFYRNIELINYSFYKNMMFSFNQIIFSFFCNFSANSIYESMMLSLINVVFTAFPIMIYSSIERDVSLKSLKKIPELYTFDGKRNWMLSKTRFWLSLLLGIAHSLVSFFVPYFGMIPFTTSKNGENLSLTDFGLTVYSVVVLIANLRIALNCTYWTWIHHLFIWGSILMLFPITLIVNALNLSSYELCSITTLFSQPAYWFSMFCSAIVALMPVVAIHACQNSKNNITNMVLHYERSRVEERMVDIRHAVDEFIPKEAESYEITHYPDISNKSGYNFDEPASISRALYNSEANMKKTKALSSRREMFDFRSLSFIPTKVSTFSLDKL